MKAIYSVLLLCMASANLQELRQLEGFPSAKMQSDDEKEFLPEGALLSPKPRKLTNSTNLAKGPCGGTEPNGAHFLSTPGSKNYFVWRINHPSPKGNCTIRLSSGTEDDSF
jgi:hypothetical protein